MRICLFLAASIVLFAQLPASQERTPDTVVATVEGKNVTLGDVRKMIDADPRLLQFIQQNPQAASQAIGQVFMLKYLAAQGDALHLADQSPLKEQLEQARNIALFQAMTNRERDGYSVSSEQIDSYFERHRSNYEQARIKVVFIGFKPVTAQAGTSAESVADLAKRALQAAHAPSDRTEAEAKTLADSIVKQIRAGTDFLEMVKKYSDDEGSKAQGGDFDTIKPNSAYPEDFRKAVFALKVGDVSDPVRQPTGFYIVRLEEKKLPPVSEVREPIVQQLRQDHLNEFMIDLQKRFRPEVKDAEFFARPSAILSGQK